MREKGVQQTCPMCRVPLPPGPEQLFVMASRKYVQVYMMVERREAVWNDLGPNLQTIIDEVYLQVCVGGRGGGWGGGGGGRGGGGGGGRGCRLDDGGLSGERRRCWR